MFQGFNLNSQKAGKRPVVTFPKNSSIDDFSKKDRKNSFQDYFDEDDEEHETNQISTNTVEDEYDPLDDYMYLFLI